MHRIHIVTLFSGHLATIVLAANHYLFTGNLSPPASIHLLEFDDVAKTIQQVKTFPADSPHNWITLDVRAVQGRTPALA